MKSVCIGLALMAGSAFGQTDTAGTSAPTVMEKPRVSRAVVFSVEKNINKRLDRMFGVDDPFTLLQEAQGMYLDRYGVVFTAEVNLLTVAGISPFRQTVSKEEIARIRTKKLERVPELKTRMREVLIDAAASLDPVPSEEQVVLGVTLFYTYWEDSHGLPGQIVMQAPRKALLDLKLGRGNPSAIRVQEF